MTFDSSDAPWNDTSEQIIICPECGSEKIRSIKNVCVCRACGYIEYREMFEATLDDGIITMNFNDKVMTDDNY